MFKLLRLPLALAAAGLLAHTSQAQTVTVHDSPAGHVMSWPAPHSGAVPGRLETASSGLTVIASTPAVSFSGTLSTTFSEAAIGLEAGICNNGGENPTGTLRVELWAYAAPFAPGAQGYKLVESANLGGLAPTMCYDVVNTGPRPYLNVPPDGMYYPALFLTEQTGNPNNDGFTYDDHIALSLNTVTVANGAITPTPSGCLYNATTLCIENQPGDGRFLIQASYTTSQGGGSSGAGQAIPLFADNIRHGGIFYFFSADNPELLIKVLPACGVNGHFWVFGSAGTNVGLSITVRDTSTGAQKVYTNADLQAAQPIQDTTAFACP
jgi:hypothetical protein